MDAWRYEPAEDLDQTLVERLRRFPRSPDMMVYSIRILAAAVMRGWMRSYHRLSVAGDEHLPTTGSFVIVANHASHLDAMCILSSLPLRRVHRTFPAAARDYFFINIRRTAIAAIAINALPFARQTGIRHSLDLCAALLENPGNVLVIFPEGTRSASGEMAEFKPGIGRLVAGTGIPVVPCYLHNTNRALPKGAWLARPRRVRAIFGPARRFDNITAEKQGFTQIARELHDAVQALRP